MQERFGIISHAVRVIGKCKILSLESLEYHVNHGLIYKHRIFTLALKAFNPLLAINSHINQMLFTIY